jgi:hypothetical protein
MCCDARQSGTAVSAPYWTFTAAAIWWAMPKALALPSMAQLEDTNRRLQHEIGERERTGRPREPLRSPLRIVSGQEIVRHNRAKQASPQVPKLSIQTASCDVPPN